MNLARAARLGLALCMISVAVFTATSSGMARPKPPPVIVPPPPPVPMPPVGMGQHFIDEAAAFAGYLRDVHGISPAFTGAGDVSGALRTGVAYEPGQLRRGAIAYAAIQALGAPGFADDVRRQGATPEARYALVTRIFANPAIALDFQGGRTAAGIAKRVLGVDGLDLYAKGSAVRQAAYDIQHQPWSLTEVPDRDARAAAVKSLSIARRTASADDVATLQQMVDGGAAGATLEPAAGPYPPMVQHAVALAALAAIGQAGDGDNLGWLTDDYFVDHCLAEAKLSLYECLAVAKPNYEDVFCLGQHALADTGACIARGAWTATPVEILTRPITLKPAHIGAHTVRRRRR